MAYPEWESGTSYPVGSIVSYNNLEYIATQYHDPANFDPPNVEMGTDPYNPIFLTQRGWTIHATLPAGYSPTPYALGTNLLIRQVDVNDWYDGYNAQYAPSPYNDATSLQVYAGSLNNPTIPCPANQCILMVTNGVYTNSPGQFTRILLNPVKPPGYTYYINGPMKPDGETNVLHHWWQFPSTYMFCRSVTFQCEEDGVPVSKTINPTDDNYTNMTTPLEWYTPSNSDFTLNFLYSGGDIGNNYDIAPND